LPSTPPKIIKTSINLPEDAIEAVREISRRTGSSMSDVIRQAISTEKYLQDTTSKGGKILIKESDNTLKELLIRR
jgi:metal-responsive CopG/Arc/MetJ family transcriptional regulator